MGAQVFKGTAYSSTTADRSPSGNNESETASIKKLKRESSNSPPPATPTPKKRRYFGFKKHSANPMSRPAVKQAEETETPPRQFRLPRCGTGLTPTAKQTTDLASKYADMANTVEENYGAMDSMDSNKELTGLAHGAHRKTLDEDKGIAGMRVKSRKQPTGAHGSKLSITSDEIDKAQTRTTPRLKSNDDERPVSKGQTSRLAFKQPKTTTASPAHGTEGIKSNKASSASQASIGKRPSTLPVSNFNNLADSASRTARDLSSSPELPAIPEALLNPPTDIEKLIQTVQDLPHILANLHKQYQVPIENLQQEVKGLRDHVSGLYAEMRELKKVNRGLQEDVEECYERSVEDRQLIRAIEGGRVW